MSVGEFYSCALNADGSVACWGSDYENRGVTTPPAGAFPPPATD